MKKHLKKIIITILGLIVTTGICFGIYEYQGRPDADRILSFLKDNPEKVSLTIQENGKPVVAYYADRSMPLASVAKIIVAIEYAKQAGAQKIDTEQMVSLKDINRFYIPGLDGNAQPQWEAYVKEQNKIESGEVSLKEVAKGMIDFSSNANMEYLIDILGLDEINKNISELKLTEHEEIYPFYASLLIPGSLMKEYKELTQEEKITKVKSILKTMPKEEFDLRAIQEHNRLKEDADGSYQSSIQLKQWYDMEIDKMNSDRLVAATTREYGQILAMINQGEYLSKEADSYLREIMEGPMEREGNKKLFKHLGFKGGSTNYILNMAMYSLDKEEQAVEIALFTDGLTTDEFKIVSKNMNEFLNQILTNKEFRQKVKGILQ
ncbi:D-alanyl-D-alanine carboxypeptidase [Anaerocolumna cellulosilytica]|uniref:D-alanyl-D-alanine carboxypeptidase n=1 Tax=Anaerocolumna cellulosilytica TaxID=433286 RepID=A0A6S6R4V9_9FIRM|nr:serine hydrolase [Anaerocolumna cellulosilytica]MBB5196350.1 D-alanyl-D-alanine carboxypeptidase [Anaerocolumna cellulosilytica]BCJ96379.1 D-alanyl-D-alanine carboxypeptidase [Anaerocolumna cellulosilytica]